MNSRQRFAAACGAIPLDRPPVWIMRQAGRTLPEYRALREQHPFLELLSTPALAAEVTLQPVRRFPLDAAIIFSDILVVPAAMGLELGFTPKLALAPVIRTHADVAALKVAGAADALGYVPDAIRLVRAEVGEERAVLGFAGAPFTVASYMVEGGSSKSYHQIKQLMYREPEVYHRLLSAVADVTVDYLLAQIAAGVDAVQLFDSWAGELSPGDFAQYALPYTQSVIARVFASGTPVIYYINGVGGLLELASASGAQVLGIDWRIELAEVRRRLGRQAVVQGNLDPGALFAAPADIRRWTQAMLEQTGGHGHIANLGHGVHPDTPLEGIAAFIEAVITWNKHNE